MAEATMATWIFCDLYPAMISITSFMLEEDPTEVPPNFNTFMDIVQLLQRR
jgi:hypothetical protein